jgi:GxxExxY protein
MDDKLKHKELTDRIIGLFFKVYNSLGYGFLEKVYENALLLELKIAGLQAFVQQPITVYYLNCEVGNYYADMIVDEKVILELKACDSLCDEHRFQLVNYLKASSIEVGLLLNFGKKPEFRRVVFSNPRKGSAVSIPRDSASFSSSNPFSDPRESAASTSSAFMSSSNSNGFSDPRKSAPSASSAFHSSPEVSHG